MYRIVSKVSVWYRTVLSLTVSYPTYTYCIHPTSQPVFLLLKRVTGCQGCHNILEYRYIAIQNKIILYCDIKIAYRYIVFIFFLGAYWCSIKSLYPLNYFSFTKTYKPFQCPLTISWDTLITNWRATFNMQMNFCVCLVFYQ